MNGLERILQLKGRQAPNWRYYLARWPPRHRTNSGFLRSPHVTEQIIQPQLYAYAHTVPPVLHRRQYRLHHRSSTMSIQSFYGIHPQKSTAAIFTNPVIVRVCFVFYPGREAVLTPLTYCKISCIQPEHNHQSGYMDIHYWCGSSPSLIPSAPWNQVAISLL